MPNASAPDAPSAYPPVYPPVYPEGTVRALLNTDLVTPPTRAALRARLDGRGDDAPPRFFGDVAFATLRAACARLVPQPDRAEPVPVAAGLDERLARGDGNGWRYAALPPDSRAYVLGLRGLDEHARAAHGAPFADLDAGAQDAALAAVQRGAVTGDPWDALPSARWFEELLADAVECYYSHPLAQEEIGYAGMADAPGWHAVGLGQLEARESRAVGAAGADARA